MLRLRQEEEHERIRNEDCTHRPAIRHYRGETEVRLSQFGKEGMLHFFERLSVNKNKSSLVSKGNLLGEQEERANEGAPFSLNNQRGLQRRSVSKENIVPNRKTSVHTKESDQQMFVPSAAKKPTYD